jgi:hypothetical protein
MHNIYVLYIYSDRINIASMASHCLVYPGEFPLNTHTPVKKNTLYWSDDMDYIHTHARKI